MTWPTRLRSSIVTDGVTATAVAAVLIVAIRVAEEPDAQPADWFAYGLGALVVALVFARWRWPRAALLGTAVAVLVYNTRYAAINPALPLAVTLYAAAAAGRLRWALAVVGFYIGAGLVVPLAYGFDATLWLLTHAVERALGMVAVPLLGDTVRSRRLRLAEAEQRLRELDRRRTAEAASELIDERLRIARDIHDAVGHCISAISIQAALASEKLDRRPEQARSALGAIRTASRQALREMQTTVSMLRSDRPSASLAELDRLLESVRRAGLKVEARRDRIDAPIPDAVDRAAYRIVQESLTNVLRHARATKVVVRMHRDGDDLLIEVTDNGIGDPMAPEAARSNGAFGLGIAGMAERAAMVGGHIDATPVAGGFQVIARLPMSRGSEQ